MPPQPTTCSNAGCTNPTTGSLVGFCQPCIDAFKATFKQQQAQRARASVYNVRNHPVIGSVIGVSPHMGAPLLQGRCKTTGCPNVPTIGMDFCVACHNQAAQYLAPYIAQYQQTLAAAKQQATQAAYAPTPPPFFLTARQPLLPPNAIHNPMKPFTLQDRLDEINPIRITDPIVGYRVFNASTYGPRDRMVVLSSMAHTSTWQPGVWKYATCDKGSGGYVSETAHADEVPVFACTCGIYAYSTLDKVYMDAMGEINNGAIIAAVLFTGKIIYHDTGFRAERARILALLRGHRVFNAANKKRMEVTTVAKAYGVPSFNKDQFLQYCTEYGRSYDLDEVIALSKQQKHDDDDKPKEYPH